MNIMYYLYVLRSLKVDRHYIGISDNPEKRLVQHNQKRVRSTKAYIPWSIIHTELFSTKTDARKRELELKKNFWKRNELFEKLEINR